MTGGQRRGPGTPPRPRRPPGGAAACPAGSGWRPYAPAVLAASRDTADSATALSASTPCARPCGRYPPISANTIDGEEIFSAFLIAAVIEFAICVIAASTVPSCDFRPAASPCAAWTPAWYIAGPPASPSFAADP